MSDCPNRCIDWIWNGECDCLPPFVPSWAFVVPAETPAEIVLDEAERHD